jgi:DNA segregation ATPase FtsK/SpoIIIE-like protein
MPWPGPSAPGASIADAPIILGEYQDGEPMTLLLPGKRGVKVVSHVMIMGMSGAGKSEGLQVFAAECLTRSDVEVEYIDAGGKAEQTVGPLRGGLTRLSTTIPDGHRHLAALEREVEPRAAHLAARGLREWEKGCGLSFKVVILDEGADMVPNNAAFTRLARKLRSVGILLVLAIQRATHNQLPTEARANFGTTICFGVRRPDDEGFALSDETILAGASPSSWANRKPGYSYIEDNGIDEMRFPIPGRFFLAAPEDVERIVQEAAPLRWQAAPVEASGAVVPDDAEEGEVVDADAPDVPDVPGGDEQEDARESEETRRAAYRPPGALADELANVDPDADLPADGINLDKQLTDPPGRRLRPEQAAAALDEILEGFRQAEIVEFQRTDLVKAGALERCDRSKGWLSGELGRRADAGQLVDVTGDRADGLYAFADALTGASNG